jgi:ABC-2 type transport system permease protein
MNAIACRSSTKTAWRRRDTLRVYLREASFQFKQMLRMPGFAVPTVLFAPMFYLFFGVVFGHGGDRATYMLATYGVFGIMSPGLFGFGVGIAMERDKGVLALKRVFPLPSAAYFFARVVMAMLFALLISSILSLLALALGGVALPFGTWLALVAVLVAGALPFCALGLAIGLAVRGQAAPAIINLVYLPMSFLSGLWVPIQLMPHFLQHFATALPAYHLAQLALGVIGHGDGGVSIHIVYLVLFTLLCLLAATRGWQRIQDR